MRGVVVVATWNVENLYRPGSAFGPRTDAAYEAKLAGLAATILASGAEVVAVQEVGDPAALTDLAGRLGAGWQTALSTHPDPRGIRVGFLSRLDLGDPVEVVNLPAGLAGGRVDDAGGVLSRLGRGALQVTVQAGGVAVTLVTCHLKSKLLSFPGGRFSPRDEDERARYAVYALNRRAAEAGAVRVHANQVLAGAGADRAVIVLGDLNDGPDAATTPLLLGPGGSETGTPGQQRPDRGDGWRLWNLTPLIPADRRYSRIYQGRRELIDHILVSHRLLDHVTAVDSLTTTLAGAGLPSVGDQPAPAVPAPSDHAPIVATLTVS